jgi:prophage antirepressor-like protein
MSNANPISQANSLQSPAPQLTPFRFEDRDVRTMLLGEQPWFCAPDICAVLGYANSRDAVAKHCRQQGVAKRDTPTGSGSQSLTFINEGNLYRLIIKSRKPEAERFEQLVMDEILPAIRKTGRYEPPAASSDKITQRAFQGRPIFFVMQDSKLWVSAANICTALGIGSTYKITRNLSAHQTCRIFRGTVNLRMIDISAAMQAADFCQTGRSEEYRQWLQVVQADFPNAAVTAQSVELDNSLYSPQQPQSEVELAARKLLATTRLLCSFDLDGKMGLHEIPSNAVVIAQDRLAEFIGDHAGAPRSTLGDILEAVGRRMKALY